MNDQKLENLLNLAISSTEEERLLSPVLGAGFDAEDKTWEVIVKYTGNPEGIRQTAEEVTELFGGFAILRIREERLEALTALAEVTFVEKPKPLYFAVLEARAAACISQVQRRGLSGAGVLFCCVDSGVSYRHPEFRNPDGSSRILYLWDQTLEGNPPEGYFLGTEFTAVQINEALQNLQEGENMVPSVDITGHGTAVLGIGAGNQGVAYGADLIVVKLGTPDERGFPRTTRLMEGVDYCVRKAAQLSKPAVINISFGNNYGAHNGNSLLEQYLDLAAGVGKNVICTGMGNEGVSAVHTSLVLNNGEQSVTEFSIGELERSTNLQLWKSYADRIKLYVEAPSGEQAGPFADSEGACRFELSSATLLIYYGLPTPYSVLQEIYIEFIPKGNYLPAGIWKLILEPVDIVENLAKLWLPVSETANTRTRFLNPVPAGSFTVPAAARNVISVAAYDSRTDSYADFSGRAFSVLPWAGKPDFAAPGVDLLAPAAGGGYRRVSGTSFATPFAAGSAALLMEWGIVKGNDPYLFGNKVKAYLRKGARALPGFSEIPNASIGFGALCLEDSLP